MSSSGLEKIVGEGLDLVGKQELIQKIKNEINDAGISEFAVIDEGTYVSVSAVHTSRKKLRDLETFLSLL